MFENLHIISTLSWLSKHMLYNTEIFIEKAVKMHGNRYDYTLVDYKHSKENVKIQCRIHGMFEQKPFNHLNGKGCLACSLKSRSDKQRSSVLEFINKASIVHENKYDYSFVNYVNSKSKVKINCYKHGIFEQEPCAHLRGKGCFNCGRENIANFSKLKKTSNTKEFVEKSLKMHGDKYVYVLVNYKTSKIKVDIICPKHGIFKQKPNAHLEGKGCPVCSESHGEYKIACLLNLYKIKYEREKRFSEHKDVKRLFFDFYIQNLNACIEYDGIQHYFPCAYFGGIEALNKLKKSDSCKDNFCFNNGIKLIRIPYFMEDKDIVSIIEKEIIKPSMQV